MFSLSRQNKTFFLRAVLFKPLKCRHVTIQKANNLNLVVFASLELAKTCILFLLFGKKDVK